MPPAATPRMATTMITTNSGSVTATDGSVGIERIERHRHQMTVGDREDDENDAQGMTISAVKNFRMTISRLDG